MRTHPDTSLNKDVATNAYDTNDETVEEIYYFHSFILTASGYWPDLHQRLLPYEFSGVNYSTLVNNSHQIGAGRHCRHIEVYPLFITGPFFTV